MPHGDRVFLPGGHNLHLDAPDALATIIGEAAAILNSKLKIQNS
jgi:hypothetical protein